MAWDNVPWFVGGGAQHSPEVGRILAYAATSGSGGVIGPGDLRVTPLDVPAGKVQVLPGVAVIPNRSTDGAYQSYIGRLPSADVIDIAPTGSSGGRIDLIVARVEDPFAAGTPWQDPADAKVGPYIFTRVIPNVPSSAVASQAAARSYLASRGESSIALSFVTLPPSTGTITASMITSIREMANPRRQRHLASFQFTGTAVHGLTVPGYGEVWPTIAQDDVDIPAWATVVRIVCTWAQVNVPGGSDVGGRLWVRMGYEGGWVIDTPFTAFDTPASASTQRSTYVTAAELAIPPSFRGRLMHFAARGSQDAVVAGLAITADFATSVVLDLEFLEAPAEDDF